MSYKSHATNQILFTRWVAPVHTDFSLLLRDLQVLHASADKKRLLAVFTILPSDMDLPDEQFRKTSTAAMQQAATYVDNFVAVLEGQGLKFSVLRSAAAVITSMANLSARAHVVATVEEGLNRLAPSVSQVDQILLKLREQGIAK